MNDKRSFERAVDRWLDDGSDVTRPEVIDVVLFAARSTPQERDLRISWGTSPMRRLPFAVAAVAALVVSVAALSAVSPLFGIGSRPTPSVEPDLRRDGEVIVFEPRRTGEDWDLAAQDPETGAVRTIVKTDGITDCPDRQHCTSFVRAAEWSRDGRGLAFQVSNASLDGPPLGPCGQTVGLWVANRLGDPRQLTTPCDLLPPGSDAAIEEVWAWSPAGDRLAYAWVDGEVDELFVIDPTDGTRTSLGITDGNVSRLAWSPDGTRIAYADGGSVLAIGADGRARSLLAESFDDIVELAWSPDGTQILVHDQGRYRIQIMNADGSDLHVLLEGKDACCSTAWSPAGDRILYMLSIVPTGGDGSGSFDSQVWTVSPDGSNRIEVFDSNGCAMGNIADSLPVWSPDGNQVAYNDCGSWVVARADGTGQARRLGGASSGSVGPPLVHRNWDGGGLSQWDLERIGQIDH